MIEAGKWYTARQAAEELGVHIETVRRWVREGRVEARKALRGQPYQLSGSDLLKRAEALRMEGPDQ